VNSSSVLLAAGVPVGANVQFFCWHALPRLPHQQGSCSFCAQGRCRYQEHTRRPRSSVSDCQLKEGVSDI